MADEAATLAKQRRRRRRRRKLIVAALVAALLVAGAGTAWALQGPNGPQYRLASVQRTDVRQTVDADGTLAARKTATAAFASAGTINAVRVAVGDKVSAGEVLATIDSTALDNEVTSARTTLAQAKQKLADDEEAQANGTTSASSASTSTTSSTSTAGTSNWTASANTTTAATRTSDAVLVAAVKPTNTGSTARSGSSLAKAQAAVVAAQQKLDAAIAQQDTYVKTLITSCAAANAGSPTTTKVTVGADGEVSGDAGDNPAIVTLLDKGGNAVQTVRLSSGGPYSFAGLTVGDKYDVQITLSAVVNTDDCTSAVQDVQAGQKAVDAALSALEKSFTVLTAAIKAQTTSGTTGSGTGGTTGSPGTGSSGTAGSRSGSTSSGTGSGSTSGSGSAGRSGSTSVSSNGSSTIGGNSSAASAGATITAQQIAADAKTIDAAKVDVAVAEQNLTTATLRSPMTGTVGAVAISKGDLVSASSSSSTITVVGTGALSIALSISLADIDQIKAGQTAKVTVDGRSAPLPATVSYVGVLNSSSSTGSSSTYSVTVQLDRTYASLYDGMGASVAIETGSAGGVLAVPISAVHTSGTNSTVNLYASGKSTTKRVTLGVVGDDIVQVKTGLTAGDRVILADIGASIPSSNISNRRRNSGSLSGLTGGTGGGPPAGGRPGGG